MYDAFVSPVSPLWAMIASVAGAGAEPSLIDRISDLVARYGWWGVLLCMALQGATLPVASEIVMMSAGWLLIQRVGASPLLILWAGLVGATGWVIGASAAYAAMATGGDALLARLRRRSPRLDAALVLTDGWFARWGIWAAFVARLLPLGRTIITLPLGAARVPFVPFALATFAGGYLWSAFLAALGYVAGSQWERVQEQLGAYALPVAVAAGAALVVGYVLVRWRRQARAGVRDGE